VIGEYRCAEYRLLAEYRCWGSAVASRYRHMIRGCRPSLAAGAALQGCPEVLPRHTRGSSCFARHFSRLSHGDPANLNPAGWFLDFSTVDSLAQFLPMSFYPPGRGARKGISPFPDVYPDPGCLMENKVWPAKGVSTKRIVCFHGAPPKSCQNFTYSYAECLRRYLRPMDGENL
jgi:hypothetical protein